LTFSFDYLVGARAQRKNQGKSEFFKLQISNMLLKINISDCLLESFESRRCRITRRRP